MTYILQSRPARHLLPLLVGLMLAACGTAPTDRGTTVPALDQTVGDSADAAADISLELPQSDHRARFNLAESALADGDWMAVTTSLAALDDIVLGADDSAYRKYLLARAAYVRGEPSDTLALLDQALAADTAPGITYRLNTFRHAVLSLAADHVSSARVALELQAWLPDEQAAIWRRKTWRELQRASDADLQEALQTATEPDWIGWLHLAQDVRMDSGNLAGAVGLWRSQYPEHPAADPLPGGMDYLLNRMPDAGPAALLLPLSGKLSRAGRAVLDGYLAAYFAARSQSGPQPPLHIVDLNGYTSVTDAYYDAVGKGVRLIIGPLSKSSVAELALLPARPVPVLALNRVANIPPSSGSALVQFSLSPQDEAHTLADAAFGRGARSALIISPAGTWGDRVKSALIERWRTLGGHLVSSATYREREDLSDSVKRALGLSASEARSRRVADMLATNMEFTPRRRQDPDVVFLLSRNSAQARSLKPLLAFHYAGDLPVFALSSIYSGMADERNQDLNGTHLVEMPWLLGTHQQLRQAIAGGGTGSDKYTRLNALGADAFLLHANFARLESGADALIRGSTGLLTMDPVLRIHRELPLATFDDGVIRPE